MTTGFEDDEAVGGQSATMGGILRYLMHEKGGNLPQAQAEDLMVKHHELVTKGIRFASFANYVGDQILRAEGLPEGEGE